MSDKKLDPEEIQRRDELIQQALSELNSFPVGLPIKSYKFQLEVDKSSDYMVIIPPIIEDEEWALRAIKKIAKDVKKIVVNKILEQLDDIQVRDFILRGSADDVAWKLTCRFFYDDSGWKQDSFGCEDEFNFSYSHPLLEITFRDIFDEVSSIYEKEHMRYRLWDESSIYSLYRFMVGLLNKDSFNLADYDPGFDGDYLDENGRYPSLAREEFLNLLSEATEMIPYRESTPLPLPFWNYSGYFNYESGVVVGEYVPLSMAGDELIDVIYNDYLKEVKSQVKFYVVEIQSQFNLELDYQFSPDELRDAENVIADLFNSLETEIQGEFNSSIGGDIFIEFSSAPRRRADNTYKLTGGFSQCFEFEDKDIDGDGLGDELIDGVCDSQLQSMKTMLENAMEQGGYDMTITSFSCAHNEVIEEPDND